MPAGLDDVAMIQHQDAVGADHARQPVRQDQRRAAPRETIDRLLDHRLVLGVDRGQCLVEDQDRRVAQQGAGDRQPLALAARQIDAALAEDRLIAVGQLQDEIMGVGVARRGFELVVGRIRLAEAQIVLDRAVEQIGVLMHHRETAAPRLDDADKRQQRRRSADLGGRRGRGIGRRLSVIARRGFARR